MEHAPQHALAVHTAPEPESGTVVYDTTAVTVRRIPDSGEFGPVPDASNDVGYSVSAVVAEVNRLHREGGVQTAKAIGRFLITSCFGGDASCIHDKARHPNSFRDLAKREDLTVSKSFLFYAVAVTEQSESLKSDVVDALSFTSQRVLLAARTADEKLDLARKTIDLGWSTRELQYEVKSSARGERPPSNAGRPKTPTFVQALRYLEKAVDMLEDESEWTGDVRKYKFTASTILLESASGHLAEMEGKLRRLAEVVEGGGDVEA